MNIFDGQSKVVLYFPLHYYSEKQKITIFTVQTPWYNLFKRM